MAKLWVSSFFWLADEVEVQTTLRSSPAHVRHRLPSAFAARLQPDSNVQQWSLPNSTPERIVRGHVVLCGLKSTEP